MSDLCGEWTAGNVDLWTGEVRAGTIWCKSWHCEYCQPIRKKQVIKQALNGEPNKFITLTSTRRPDEMTPDQAAQQLVHAWRMVVQRGKREKLFKDIQYIAIFEETKLGWPHLHILARCSWLAQAWLSDRLEEYAQSPIVDIRQVRQRSKQAFYVAKYLGKAPQRYRGCKRYWRTLGYDLSPDKRDRCLHDHFMGYMRQTHITEIAALYDAHGYVLAWDSEHSFVAYPSHTDFYEHQRARYKQTHSPPYKEHHA